MRKKYLSCSILPLLVLVLFSLDPKEAIAEPTLIHHDLQILLKPADQGLSGRAILTSASPWGNSLLLEMSPTATIRKVLLGGAPVEFGFRRGRLSVDLSRLAGNADRELQIDYEAIFDDTVPSRPVHSEDPSYGVSASISPAGVFLGGGTGWYPFVPGSTGSMILRVLAPEGWTAVTAGRFVGTEVDPNGQSTRWEISEAVQSLALAAAPYRIETGTSNGIPIYTFFLPTEENLSSAYLKASERYLELYRDLFGRYPFPKFAVAENFFPTGYGFPSWTLLGSTVIRLPFILHTSLPHEIAHSWWGNGVKVDYRQGNWSEGLTTYVSDYYLKELSSGSKAREYRRKILRDFATLVTPGKDFPLDRFVRRDSAAGQAVGYGKAAMVFHMVRRRIGDDAFWKALKALATERMFEKTSWDDFERSFSVQSGQDLSPFFRQWVKHEGAPSLALQDVEMTGEGDAWTITGTLVQTSLPAFSFDILLAVESTAGPTETILAVDSKATRFRLSVPGRPLNIRADPEYHLFRRLDPAEIPPLINGIRGSTSLLVVVADGFPDEFLPAAELLLAALRQNEASLVREKDLSGKDLEHDLLFIGVPVRPDVRPSLPPSLAVEDGLTKISGQTFSGSGTALFAALPHPASSKKTAAVFHPFSLEAGLAAARKIPHYGKYSYLVFEDGINRAKGTWEPSLSPLQVSFPIRENNR